MTTPKITQAMINAYDEYTHLTLDRRGSWTSSPSSPARPLLRQQWRPCLPPTPARAAIVPADDPG